MEDTHVVALPALANGAALGITARAAYVMDASSTPIDAATPLFVCLDASGSMRENGRDMLREALTRLLTFVAESGRPATVLTYSNRVTLLDAACAKAVWLCSSTVKTAHVGARGAGTTFSSAVPGSTYSMYGVPEHGVRESTRVYDDTYVYGFNVAASTLIPALRRAVNVPLPLADVPTLVTLYLNELFDTGGSTWMATALGTVGDLLAVLAKEAHKPAVGIGGGAAAAACAVDVRTAQVLLVCDGAEWYGEFGRTTGELVEHAVAAFVKSTYRPTVSVLALSNDAHINTLAALATSFNGVLAYAGSVKDLGYALVTIFRFMLYEPQALAVAGDADVLAWPDAAVTAALARYAGAHWTGQYALGTVQPAKAGTAPTTASPQLQAAAVAALLAEAAWRAMYCHTDVRFTVKLDMLTLAAIQTSVDAVCTELRAAALAGGGGGSSAAATEAAVEHALAPLRALAHTTTALVEAHGNGTLPAVAFSLYTTLVNMARMPFLATTGIPPALTDRFEALQYQAAVLAAKRAFVAAQAARLEGDDAAFDRYSCMISLGADDVLGFPARPELKSGRDVGSLEYAATFSAQGGFNAHGGGHAGRDAAIPSALHIKVAPRITLNTGAIVAVGPYDEYHRAGYKQPPTVRIVTKGAAAKAAYDSDDGEDVVLAAGGAGGTGDAVLLSGKEVSIAKRVRAGAIARRLAEGAAKVSHMTAREVLPILLAAEDADNEYAATTMLRKLAALADGTEDAYAAAWAPYLPLQVYGAVVGGFLAGGASESETLALTDLVRTLAFWLRSKRGAAAAGAAVAMGAAVRSALPQYKVRAAMCSLPPVAAVLVAAGQAGAPTWDAVCSNLWFETARRALKGTSGQAVANPTTVDPAVLLADTGFAATRADRFVGTVRVLAETLPAILREVPVSAATLVALAPALQGKVGWRPPAYGAEVATTAILSVAAQLRDDKTYVTTVRAKPFDTLFVEAQATVFANGAALDELQVKMAGAIVRSPAIVAAAAAAAAPALALVSSAAPAAAAAAAGATEEVVVNYTAIFPRGYTAATAADFARAAGRLYHARPHARANILCVCTALLQRDLAEDALERFAGKGHMHAMQLDVHGDASLGAAVAALPAYGAVQAAKRAAQEAKLAALTRMAGAASATLASIIKEASLTAVFDAVCAAVATLPRRTYTEIGSGVAVTALVRPSEDAAKTVTRLTHIVYNTLGPAREYAVHVLSGMAESDGEAGLHGTRRLRPEVAAQIGFVRRVHLGDDLNVGTLARAACIVALMEGLGLFKRVWVEATRHGKTRRKVALVKA